MIVSPLDKTKVLRPIGYGTKNAPCPNCKEKHLIQWNMKPGYVHSTGQQDLDKYGSVTCPKNNVTYEVVYDNHWLTPQYDPYMKYEHCIKCVRLFTNAHNWLTKDEWFSIGHDSCGHCSDDPAPYKPYDGTYYLFKTLEQFRADKAEKIAKEKFMKKNGFEKMSEDGCRITADKVPYIYYVEEEVSNKALYFLDYCQTTLIKKFESKVRLRPEYARSFHCLLNSEVLKKDLMKKFNFNASESIGENEIKNQFGFLSWFFNTFKYWDYMSLLDWKFKQPKLYNKFIRMYKIHVIDKIDSINKDVVEHTSEFIRNERYEKLKGTIIGGLELLGIERKHNNHQWKPIATVRCILCNKVYTIAYSAFTMYQLRVGCQACSYKNRRSPDGEVKEILFQKSNVVRSQFGKIQWFGHHIKCGTLELPFCKEIKNLTHRRVLRQVKIANYYVDFYIPKFNLCIEFDERHHFIISDNGELVRKPEDTERQNKIVNRLECSFLRVSWKMWLEKKEVVIETITRILNEFELDVNNKKRLVVEEIL